MTTALTKPEHDRQTAIAYLLMVPCFFGLFGLHRIYAGRWISGIIWLVTFGVCGWGQLVDVFFVPRMIEDYNSGRKVW